MTGEALVDALKSLVHPVRLRIMQALTGTERTIGEIEDAADLGQPTPSLVVLGDIGARYIDDLQMTDRRKDG